MAEKKPNLHKTLFFLILVFVPPYWLLFTDEGSRLSDTALLWLLGEDEIKFNVKELSADFTRADIQTVFGDLGWQCEEQATELGDSLCAARIGTFNGFPSRLLTLYFRDGHVNAMRLNYREPYHEQLLGHFIGQLGQPGNVEQALSGRPDAADVLEWRLERGVMLMKKTLGKTDEATVLWLATTGSAPPGST